MVESDGGEFSTLTLRMHLGSEPEFPNVLPSLHVDLARYIQAGSKIRLVDRADNNKEWFVGYVGQDATLVQGSPQAEDFQVSVYGPEWLLAGTVVTGQWYANLSVDQDVASGIEPSRGWSSIILTDMPCVFNDHRRPNMSQELWTVATDDRAGDDGIGGAVFVTPDARTIRNGAVVSQAQHWTAYAAVRSVVELFDNYEVISPSTDWKAIKAVLGGVTIGEVSIDGLPLNSAIQAILGPLGYGFRLDVVSDGIGNHVLSVYPLVGAGTGKSPYLPPIGSSATDSRGVRGEVSRLEFLRDSHNIRNAVTVMGNQERVQVTLTYASAGNSLWPAWSTDSNPMDVYLEGGSFNIVRKGTDDLLNNHHTTGINYPLYRDVWRTFVFNEDGGLDSGLYGSASVPSLMNYGLGNTLFARPIQPLLVRESRTGEFRKPIVTMSVVIGSETVSVDVSDKFEILADRAGIRVRDSQELFEASGSHGRIDSWRPFAEKKGSGPGGKLTTGEKAAAQLSYLSMLNNALTSAGSNELVLTVTGTMESDTAVKGETVRLPASPMNLRRERLVRNRAINKFSIHGAALGDEDVRNDSAVALLHAKTVRFADDSEIGHGSIMLHHLTRAYPPGTTIAQTSGRVLNLRLDGQRKGAAPVVRKTTHHFGQTMVTEVLLDSPLLRLT